MSKTIKTRPLVVRLAPTGDLVAREIHNHQNSECNLPPRTVEGMTNSKASSGCYWTFSHDGTNVCGCKMCTRQVERHGERKSLRRTESINLAHAVNEFNSGVPAEDLDVFVPPRQF